MNPTPGIVASAVVGTAGLALVGYLTWLDRRIRKIAAKHKANLEAAVEAERKSGDDEKPPVGDTLVAIGRGPESHLVHRRCADARRDGQTPGPCCAARLEVRL